jgi:hypothetical protein
MDTLAKDSRPSEPFSASLEDPGDQFEQVWPCDDITQECVGHTIPDWACQRGSEDRPRGVSHAAKCGCGLSVSDLPGGGLDGPAEADVAGDRTSGSGLSDCAPQGLAPVDGGLRECLVEAVGIGGRCLSGQLPIPQAAEQGGMGPPFRTDVFAPVRVRPLLCWMIAASGCQV